MTGYESARKLLSDHLDLLNRIAMELLEKEVLNGSELDALIGIGKPQDAVNPVPEANT
jgi:ATP-dependent Zn protease